MPAASPSTIAARIAAWASAKPDKASLRGGRSGPGDHVGARGLGDKGGEVGQVIVPLDQRWTRSDTSDDISVKIPCAGVDAERMRIDENVPIAVFVGLALETAEVILANGSGRQRVDIGAGVEAHVVARDMDIAHVAQQAAAGPLHELSQ